MIIKKSNSTEWLAVYKKAMATLRECQRTGDQERAARACREVDAAYEIYLNEVLYESDLANSVKVEYANSSESVL